MLVGQDNGPTPVEFVLHALAACLTAGLANIAAARKVTLTEVRSTVSGDIDLNGILGLEPRRPQRLPEDHRPLHGQGDASPETLSAARRAVHGHAPPSSTSSPTAYPSTSTSTCADPRSRHGLAITKTSSDDRCGPSSAPVVGALGPTRPPDAHDEYHLLITRQRPLETIDVTHRSDPRSTP